jgi:hypothetical protein
VERDARAHRAFGESNAGFRLALGLMTRGRAFELRSHLAGMTGFQFLHTLLSRRHPAGLSNSRISDQGSHNVRYTAIDPRMTEVFTRPLLPGTRSPLRHRGRQEERFAGAIGSCPRACAPRPRNGVVLTLLMDGPSL